MTFAEVKEEVLRLSNEERREILKLLLRVRADFDENWMNEMERRHREVAAGRGISRDEALKRWEISAEDLEAARAEWKNLSGS